MPALLPEQEGRGGIEHAVGEDGIVTHAADHGLIGNAENQQGKEARRQLFRPDKERHGDGDEDCQVAGVGVDVADAGSKDDPVCPVRDLIEEAEDI